jgi:hypothetical protein
MTFVTNEKLAAYADGELDDAESAQMSRALAEDDLLRARLTRITSLDNQLRAAFELDNEGVPHRLTQMLEAEAAPGGRLRRWIPAGAAIAAGVAGVAIGGLLPAETNKGWLEASGGSFALAGTAQTAADHMQSGSRYVAHSLTVQPIVSFFAGDGRPCRELQIDEEGAMGTRAVACREQGQWRVEALVRSRTQSSGEGYRPASGNGDAAIGAVHARLNMTTVLDATAEDEAISAGWPTK